MTVTIVDRTGALKLVLVGVANARIAKISDRLK